MKIILGSSSAGRQMIMNELAKEFCFTFEVMSPDINEKAIRFDNPEDFVLAIANAKADALLPKITESAILICSDQICMYKDKIREKPIDENEARKFLNSWNEEPAVIIGSVVVVNTKTGEKASGLQKSRVHFKVISEKVIDEHIRNGSSMRGCGGISITDPILHDYIKNIEGGFDSAAGLSKELVKRLVIQVGGDSIFMSKNEK